ncbi:uncharacterized protein B0I36DRAFT_370800 [Microdochium trichocladiopsis]|uniref:DUF7029 domain-containing protein n=1 Tax=Microdochium trichocladiopsis TaxID=1682393 RepID=A0A9P8YIU1_9PEZI|nr:uncharacterized protein B0I36DRAFT_370800 [Microdochium trichocladiopsis]KAH7039820.1 hypothetical protein B0I36DRAFT_370800 [Microdochium trichocladiopsis]
MHVLRSGLLALLASTALAKSLKETTTLKPISKAKGLQRRADDPACAPKTSIGFDYGIDADPMVHVDLDMQNPAVVLEDVAAIKNVSCSATSISIAFATPDGFQAAVASWEDKGDLVFFTNHLGGCDVEDERGVFLVNSISSCPETLTIVAKAEKKDVASTATNTAITFQGVPVGKKRKSVARQPLNERGITLNEKGLNIAGTIGLPRSTPLYSFPPYLEVTADSAEISASVTFSGYLDFNVFGGKIKQLYVDIDSSIDAEVGISIAASAGYRDSFTYSPGEVSFMIVNVPGIISLGPELLFAIGLDLDVEAGISVTGSAGAGMQNGRIHLDFLDTSKTSVTPWKPVYNAKLDLSQRALVKADTWIDVTFQLGIEILGGVVDVSAGLTARPRFNNEFALTASQGITPGGVTQPNELACAQGLSIKSDFSFTLIAFVTKMWSRTVYNTYIPIANKCYSWV